MHYLNIDEPYENNIASVLKYKSGTNKKAKVLVAFMESDTSDAVCHVVYLMRLVIALHQLEQTEAVTWSDKAP